MLSNFADLEFPSEQRTHFGNFSISIETLMVCTSRLGFLFEILDERLKKLPECSYCSIKTKVNSDNFLISKLQISLITMFARYRNSS